MKIDFAGVANFESPAVGSYSSALAEVRGKPVLWLNGGNSQSSNYVDQNAFGAKRTGEKHVATSLGIVPINWPARRSIVIEEPMPAPRASDHKFGGRWRSRGSLTGNAAHTWRVAETPTLSDPQEKQLTYFLARATMVRVELIDAKGAVVAAIEPIR